MNRKQRNLLYIRNKNKLRAFEPLCVIMKISEKMQGDLLNRYIDLRVNSYREYLTKLYKTDLEIISKETYKDNEHVLNGLLTYMVVFKRPKN